MSWWMVLLIIVGILLKMATTPPSAVVGWVVSKFALHPKLDPNEITVTYNGTNLSDEEKHRFAEYFNDALFLERNHIFPGSEHLFLNPETDITPFVIKVKRKNKETKLFVYCNDEQVDVVKQSKKKVAAYSLSSEKIREIAVG